MAARSAWRAWLEDELAGSAVATEQSVRRWSRAIEALESASDPHARRLVERMLRSTVVLWRLAEHRQSGDDGDMRASGARAAASSAAATVAGHALASIVGALTSAEASTAPAPTDDPKRDVGDDTTLPSALLGVALGAVAGRASVGGAAFDSAGDAGRAAGSVEAQLREWLDAVEAGYAANAGGDAFAEYLGDTLNRWVAEQAAHSDPPGQ